MKWWIWLWLGMIVALTIGGAWDDYRNGRRLVGTALGVTSGLLCLFSVLSFAQESLAATLGKLLLPMSVLAGVQVVADAARDVRALSPDPELTARENRAIETFGILAVASVFGAAVIVGIILGVQQW